MTKKGFTLIEMIVVIVLIGVIAVAAIPKVIKLMQSQSNDKYSTHMKLVEDALDLYSIRYKGRFDDYPNADIYRIDYTTLVNEDLLIEDGINCDGVIDLTKMKNGSYDYTYYLRCTEDGKADPHSDEYGTEPPCNDVNNCAKIDN